ncbi:MAG TPA: hypothetical protein VIP11_22500 [Gemmatimonadaceae bacterium]
MSYEYDVPADVIKERLVTASRTLGTANPLPAVGPIIERSFSLPSDSREYGANTLSPGAVAFEPSFSENESSALRFVMEPLAGASPVARQQEATREMRRLVAPTFGRDALHWFDQRSEDWRGMTTHPHAAYGAWFGAAFDQHGLAGSKVYYELRPGQLDAIPRGLRNIALAATESVPGLTPLFTTIRCGRQAGSQRVTFLHRGWLRVADLAPLMTRLGMAHHLPSVMQIVGVALGGRFELPDAAVMLGVAETVSGPELRIEIALGMLPDVPAAFVDLLALSLAERPRELHALGKWLRAFTPDDGERPGKFSVLTLRTTRDTPARVNLYLRPAELELQRRAREENEVEQNQL